MSTTSRRGSSTVTYAPPASAGVGRGDHVVGRERIGHFELIREIARGGMGQVFLARDTKLGRKVAIKFLLRTDPEFVSRFLVEARATARCTHEHIVTIHEVGEHRGLPFLVFEYLEGKTLTEVLAVRPSVEQFTELVIGVVSALARAHAHGIVHRDLKPANIFITDRGVVKVLDFGIAQFLDDSDAPSEAMGDQRAWIVGTSAFMSPEQWTSSHVDHRSDLWQVGILFWRAFAGVHPAGTFDDHELRARISDLSSPLPSIASRVPSIPSGLAAIVDRCLAKRADDRYQHASDVLEALRSFASPVATTDDVGPYRGLAAFGEQDAKFFFGRASEVRAARAMFDRWPVLAVIGPSGVGKSSFVQAGLVPALRTGGETWQVHTIRPGRSPLQRLASLIEATSHEGTFVEHLQTAPGMFGERVRAEAARRKQHTLIVVDQLEELFTLGADPTEQRIFLAALLAAADDTSAPVRVVVSMRPEFLERISEDTASWAELSRGLLFLTAPGRDNLREALVRPAELAGYAFETPALVEEVLQVASSRAALPLLSFAATQLWDARDRERRLITVAAYQAMGGVGGAFAGHAERAIAGIPATQRRLLRAMLTRLVTPDGTRAVVDRRELLSIGGREDDAARILEQLIEARLVQLHAEPEHGTTVELVHEVLITEWPTLARWLDDQQAVRGFLEELRTAARQWRSRGKPDELVWRGQPAEEALAFAGRYGLELADEERAYLTQIQTQRARARRRRRFAIGSVIVTLGLVIAGGAVAVVRISAAERVATQQAKTAAAEAERARAAELERSRQLEELKAARGLIVKTDGELQSKSADLKKADDELRTKNVALERALAKAEHDSARASTAETAATTANARLQDELRKKRARVQELERELKKYSRGGL